MYKKKKGGKKEYLYWNDNLRAPKIDMDMFTKDYMAMVKQGKRFDMVLVWIT